MDNNSAYKFNPKRKCIVKQKTKVTVAIVLGMILFFTPSIQAHRYMERLGRGVVAVNQGSGNVYVGWRMLGTDPCDVGFNIYRNSVKLNASPITTSTNWLDTGVNIGQANTYLISPVIGGQELPSHSLYKLPANAPVTLNGLNQAYLAIDLQDPYKTVMRYSIGDLYGDGEYEYLVKSPSQIVDPGGQGYPNYNDITPRIDAYKLDGTRLWYVDLGHNIEEGIWYSPMIVYDLDGDGKAEVVQKTAEGTVDGAGSNN